MNRLYNYPPDTQNGQQAWYFWDLQGITVFVGKKHSFILSALKNTIISYFYHKKVKVISESNGTFLR